MKHILHQVEQHYVELRSRNDWDNFKKISLTKLKNLFAIYIDNIKDSSPIDYEFISHLAKLSRFAGWGEFEIIDHGKRLKMAS